MKDRIVYSGIMGLIVGDALGVPYEFKKRDTFKAEDMTGYGTYNQPPGTWSDDSSMTLATMHSIFSTNINRKNRKRIDPDDIMHHFQGWFYNGYFTPYGKCFDIGNTTRTAIENYTFKEGYNVNNCGCSDVLDNGNGALMRVLPLAFMNCSESEIDSVTALTHAHRISKIACRLYVNIAERLINGISIDAAIRMILTTIPTTIPTEFERLHSLNELTRDGIKSSGYVIDTLEAALWCLLHTDNYKDCVLTAVNLGDDTDTVAAVAGGLAGIAYGYENEKGIPQEWIKKVIKQEYIKQSCEDFAKII